MHFNQAILSTVAAAVGMFPEGLYLLTSVALTISAVSLARKKLLVQELNCIDALARVDTLCLDKTGTITQGKMVVEEVIELDEEIDITSILGSMMAALPDKNPTALALRREFPENASLVVNQVVPFSSDRKFSCVSFEGEGTYFLGASAFLLLDPIHQKTVLQLDKKYSKLGYRVLTLGYSNSTQDFKAIKNIRPVAMFLITDTIRDNVIETLQFFDQQNVNCKIISGDDPTTVAQIAHRVQLPGADKYIDMSEVDDNNLKDIVENYQIFGRVSPQ